MQNSEERGNGEASREAYLRSLPREDRDNLARTLTLIFSDNLSRAGSIMALAVGTTTFPHSYWAGLERYLEGKDEKMRRFVERHGEDIDVKLCPDFLGCKSTGTDWEEIIERVLQTNRIDYGFNPESGPSRVKYLDVPPEFRKEYGGEVLRMKDVDYGPNFRINSKGSRPIHISFDFTWCGATKLEIERREGAFFSVLFRNSQYWELNDAVGRVNMQGELFGPI